MIKNLSNLKQILDLFASEHGGRTGCFREERDWVNSAKGQAILIANGIHGAHFATDEECVLIEAEVEAEGPNPVCVLMDSMADLIRAASIDKRQALMKAADQCWEEINGGDLDSYVNKNRDPVAYLARAMIKEIKTSCAEPRREPNRKWFPFHVVPKDKVE